MGTRSGHDCCWRAWILRNKESTDRRQIYARAKIDQMNAVTRSLGQSDERLCPT